MVPLYNKKKLYKQNGTAILLVLRKKQESRLIIRLFHLKKRIKNRTSPFRGTQSNKKKTITTQSLVVNLNR